MAGPSSLQQEAIPDALQKSCLILSCCLARRSQGGLMTLLTFLCLPCCLDKSRPMDGSDQLVWEAVTTSSLCSLSTKDCTQVKIPHPTLWGLLSMAPAGHLCEQRDPESVGPMGPHCPGKKVPAIPEQGQHTGCTPVSRQQLQPQQELQPSWPPARPWFSVGPARHAHESSSPMWRALSPHPLPRRDCRHCCQLSCGICCQHCQEPLPSQAAPPGHSVAHLPSFLP